MPAALPIDALLPEIEARLRERPNLVIQADPGAGKTTRVPPFLLERGLCEAGGEAGGEGGRIVVAQPRRLAARMAAQRVASERGEPVGQRVGYQVRFESRTSDATRIVFVTEGLLVRRLRDDPLLRGVAAVVLDEFHERHVDTDVALALLRRMQQGPRPDLRILVMSATLDPGPVAAFLDAPALRSAGRSFPVEVEHSPERSERGLPLQVAEAVRQLGRTGLDGSVLVFLPGAREIRECTESCAGVAASLGLEVAALHGELPAAEQDRAVAPGRKLILSTNVAETSITIEGVAAVIDSGLVRRPSHDPWSGLPTLTLAKISRASAEQRAGRAGRTRAGRCIRLYAQHDLERRPAFDEPELARLDLAGAMLDLRAHGLHGAHALAWLDAPPAAAVAAAEGLLRRLGATVAEGGLTAVGREMLRYPVHPRLARLLVEARRRGIASLGVAAAALLGERPLRRTTGPHDHSRPHEDAAAADVLADIARLDAVRRDPGQSGRLGLDRGALRQVEQARRQLAELVARDAPPSRTPEDDLCLALLVAFPDRVARVETRRGQPDRLVMAAGGEAELSPASAVHGAKLVVAVAAEQRHDPGRRGTRTVVRSAAAIEPEQLLELGDEAPNAVVEEIRVRFDPEHERVEAVRETRYDGLVIDSAPLCEVPPQAAALLREAALARGARAFVHDPAALDGWLARVSFAAAHHPGLRPRGEDDVARVLGELCEGRRSFAELRRADLLATLQAEPTPEELAALHRLAPEHVTLPGGRRLAVRYELDRAPWVESRLQDFFGAAAGPTVAQGKVPLVLHLLAPNHRAVQVTTDLAGFWARHYPELRNALMRRYPRHAWPEDPRHAAPPPPSGRRR